ncbi:MAG: hypothetical protein VW405_10770 [Rhodospirillaceae bacterium]
MSDPTLIPHAGAFAGLAIGIAARVLASRSPEAEPRARGFLAGLGLLGLVVGGVVAVASGNPTALLALDPGAVAQACVDVVATVGLLMAPAAAPGKPAA